MSGDGVEDLGALNVVVATLDRHLAVPYTAWAALSERGREAIRRLMNTRGLVIVEPGPEDFPPVRACADPRD